MFRKLLSVLFAALILFNISGYYFVFKCNQIRVKGEMNAMIRSAAFSLHSEEIIIVNPSNDPNFKMIDKDEILYKGRMYDVISARHSGNSVIFRCINDRKEDQLLARYDKYSSWAAGLNAPEKTRNSQAILYHIIKHALVNKYSVQPPSMYTSIRFCDPIQAFSSAVLLPDFPPPKLA